MAQDEPRPQPQSQPVPVPIVDQDTPLLSFIAQFTARTGIEVGTRRRAFIRCLAERAAELGFPTLTDYLKHIAEPGPEEIGALVRSLLLGYTWFFRDPDQLELLIELLDAQSSPGHQSSIWIAGCATGEEAYSLAMMLTGGHRQGSTFILATDIDEQSVAFARAGRYPAGSLRMIPQQYRGLVYVANSHGGSVQMSGELQRRVRFAEHNLMNQPPQPPLGGGWDVIICRNVLMHLAMEQRAIVLRMLAAALAPGGCLLVGASEYLQDLEGLERCERSGRFFLRRPPLVPSPPRPPVLPLSDSLSQTEQAEPSSQPQVKPAASRVASELQSAAADIQRGRMEPALLTLRGVLERTPLCSEALLLLGLAHHLGGADDAAVLVLQQALFVRPELWPAAFYLGQSLERLGQPAAAVSAYRWVERESVRPLPDEPALLALLGVAQWRQELLHASSQRLRTLRPGPGPGQGHEAGGPQKKIITLGDANAEPGQDKNPSRG